MNTELQEKDFFNLMNNSVSGTTMKLKENMALNLQQQKKEEIIWNLNQIILQQRFSQKI